MQAAAHPWPRVNRAPTRPRKRREAGRAPAIGIEARKGRDPAPPGLGAKHESPGPEGASPGKRPREAMKGPRPELCAGTDADKLQRIGPVAVRVPLHVFEVAPELRRALDGPHVAAYLPPRPSVFRVDLADRLGRTTDFVVRAARPRLSPQWSGLAPVLQSPDGIRRPPGGETSRSSAQGRRPARCRTIGPVQPRARSAAAVGTGTFVTGAS